MDLMEQDQKKFMDEVNKRYKGTESSPVLFTAESSLILKIPRLRTGIFSLDLGLGGGLPQGRVIRIFGPPSGGKSLLCMRVIRENQHLCRVCWNTYVHEGKEKCCAKPSKFRTLWLDVEGVWTNEWAAQHGINLDQVMLVRSEFAEQALDIAHSALSDHVVDLVIIDSLAQLTTSKELESSQEDAKVALNARAINEFMRKCVSDLNKHRVSHKPTVLLVNQIRYAIGAYGDPETLPGGMGQEFASSVDIRLHRYAVLTDKGKQTGPGANNDSSGLPVGALTAFRIPKNKTAPPHRTGEYYIWFSNDPRSQRKVGDIDCSDAIFEYGVRYGVLTKEKRNYVFYDTDQTLFTLDTKKDEVKKQLFSDPFLYSRVQEAVLTRILEGGVEVKSGKEEEGEDLP